MSWRYTNSVPPVVKTMLGLWCTCAETGRLLLFWISVRGSEGVRVFSLALVQDITSGWKQVVRVGPVDPLLTVDRELVDGDSGLCLSTG